jgi:regulator of chromosome condensation
MAPARAVNNTHKATTSSTTASTARKRRADENDNSPDAAPAGKRRKAPAPKKSPVKKPPVKKPPTTTTALDLPPSRAPINSAPTQRLDVYVFGEGSSGELGLGNRIADGKQPTNVKRPRHNAKLAPATVGVVQVACGGMHAVALTADNKILTWGVNDQGALGRDTVWHAAADIDDKAASGLNPLESTPTEVSEDFFAPGTKFAMVAASDSASFVLTEDGFVYGWGTFRVRLLSPPTLNLLLLTDS